MRLGHKFVDQIPEELDEGVLYVSIQFGTVVHKCACGCGEEVVTPLGPAEWQLTYDGRTVSLAPSVGNWSFPCRSHYWIEGSNVRWASGFSGAEVALVRQKARTRRASYYSTGSVEQTAIETDEVARGEPMDEVERGAPRSIWAKIRDLRRSRNVGE